MTYTLFVLFCVVAAENCFVNKQQQRFNIDKNQYFYQLTYKEKHKYHKLSGSNGLWTKPKHGNHKEKERQNHIYHWYDETYNMIRKKWNII